jgi:hypothetical protein
LSVSWKAAVIQRRHVCFYASRTVALRATPPSTTSSARFAGFAIVAIATALRHLALKVGCIHELTFRLDALQIEVTPSGSQETSRYKSLNGFHKLFTSSRGKPCHEKPCKKFGIRTVVVYDVVLSVIVHLDRAKRLKKAQRFIGVKGLLFWLSLRDYGGKGKA